MKKKIQSKILYKILANPITTVSRIRKEEKSVSKKTESTGFYNKQITPDYLIQIKT